MKDGWRSWWSRGWPADDEHDEDGLETSEVVLLLLVVVVGLYGAWQLLGQRIRDALTNTGNTINNGGN